MKRSEINEIMQEADAMIRRFGFVLPPFAYMPPLDLAEHVKAAPGIVSGRLGWDITDYGQGSFADLGLFLFTLRNGRLSDLQTGGGMCYAEKLLISRQDQISPMHRHILKAEDIINRGGATLAIELFGSDPAGGFDETAGGEVFCDGARKSFQPGDVLKLEPGESVTLMPGDWHAFWGDGGDVLIGEVSTVNDDETDNVFREPIGRFSDIEEDVAPLHLLVSDYGRVFAG
ncbi:MAG TPA: D-lyxose/D-mannose family sugar isomerase [Aliiroseovarius sp.]|nr:D-lyxose/D-mannose family sugar isomerase [Aliiroseovarius sp.]